MRVGRAFRVCLVALATMCAGSACSSAGVGASRPRDTLKAYAEALEQGRVDDAYRLLSEEAKRTMSLEAFRRAVEENPDDVREIARAVARPTDDPVVTATVTVPNGEELRLVYEGGRWKVDAAAVDLYGQSTPRQALLGFLRAFDRKRYDVMLRYVPDAEKEGVVGAEPAGAGGETGAGGAAAPGPGEGAAAPGPGEGTTAAPDAAPDDDATRLTADKLRAAYEGPQKEQMSRIVQAIRAALPDATIEETGDQASMAYGAGGTVAFVREHGVWKIKDF